MLLGSTAKCRFIGTCLKKVGPFEAAVCATEPEGLDPEDEDEDPLDFTELSAGLDIARRRGGEDEVMRVLGR